MKNCRVNVNMVLDNTGYPDPGKGNEDLPPTDEVVNHATETDTEDEESDYQGYQPLPVNDFIESSNSEEEENAIGAAVEETSNVEGLPPISPIEHDLVREVWSKTHPRTVDIEMDSTKVDEVKQVMQNITLPESSIPAWATNIPEDEWKQTLIEKLQRMKEKH